MKKKIQLKLLSKLLIFVFLIGNISFSLDAEASGLTGLPTFLSEINYGRGVFSAQAHGGAICYDEDGRPLMCFSAQGGTFYVCDLMSGQVIAEYETTDDSYVMSHLVKTASDGKVYNHYYPANYFDVYDPLSGTYEAVIPDVEIRSQDGGNVTEDGKILLGSYYDTGACAYEYDIATNTVTTYGPLDTDCHYVKGIVSDDNYIYAGTGVGAANTKVIRIDKKTGEQTEFLTNTNAGIIYNMKITSDRIIAQTNGVLHIINKSTLVRERMVGGNAPSDPMPGNENIVYTAISGTLYEINIATGVRTAVGIIPVDEYGDMEFTQWATLPNGNNVLGFRSFFMNKIGYYNPNTKEVIINNLSKTADEGPKMQSLEISEDGIIYMGGYQTAMSAFDSNEDKFVYKLQSWEQNEGVGFLNGKTYFGTYTGARIWRYDPEKELNYQSYNGDGNYQGNNVNPSMVYDIGDSQDRPFVVKDYEDKLYIGTIPAYNTLGGALVIYEEDEEGTPSAVTYRNVIPDQSITGIAVKDNLVYISSSIRGGLGIEATETQAKIAVFDTNTNTVVTEPFAPDLPVAGTNSVTIGELAFGPDGLLWGCSSYKGLVFAMDPDTFEVKKYISLTDTDLGSLMRPLYLKWDKEGYLYTTAGYHLYVINPDTLEYKRLVRNTVIMSLDAYGNIWYADDGDFIKIPRKLSEDILNAELDEDDQKINLYGVIAKEGTCTVKITSPDGNIVMFDEFTVSAQEKIKKHYAIDDIQSGTYTIYVDNENFDNVFTFEMEASVPQDEINVSSKIAFSEDVSGQVNISNFFDVTKKVHIMLGAYKIENGKEQLLNYKWASESVEPGKFNIFSIDTDINSNGHIYKLFVWDEYFNPLSTEKSVR